MAARIFAGSLVTLYGRQGPLGGGLDAAALRGRVQLWLDDLNRSLTAHLAEPLCLAWGTDGEFDLEVSDAVIHAVRLLAGYAQFAELSWPDAVPVDWRADPAWRRASDGDFAATRFPQVLIPDFWLPGDFAFTARQPLPDGEEGVLGSLSGLTEQLTALNQQTLQVPAARLLRAVDQPPAVDSRDFLALAEYGLGVWLAAAVQARTRAGVVVIRRSGDE